MVCASEIARTLRLGEVTVRRDLNSISFEGRPKIGYPRRALLYDLEEVLGVDKNTPAVIVGAGRLGCALCRFDEFEKYGLTIKACFDSDNKKTAQADPDCPILDMKQFHSYCLDHEIRIGIITVPSSQAQRVCDEMIESGITAIWNFAPCQLRVPKTVTLQQENLALSLAFLKSRSMDCVNG